MNKAQQLYVLLAIEAALENRYHLSDTLESFAARDVAKRKNAWLEAVEKLKDGATFFESVAGEFDEGVAAILGTVKDNFPSGLRGAIEYLRVTIGA